MKCWIIGYDPGGNNNHGVAALEVHAETGRWIAEQLMVGQESTVGQVKKWFERVCAGGRIVAVGIDTLTEWNDGSAGWRPADLELRSKYRKKKEVVDSVVHPNYISGAMSLNGAILLLSLAERFQRDGTIITEAHPKVCFFALTKKVAKETSLVEMTRWLLDELSVPQPNEGFGSSDHAFDAAMATLAALRGINGDWALDLHTLTNDTCGERVLPFGPTYYWWPGNAEEEAIPRMPEQLQEKQ